MKGIVYPVNSEAVRWFKLEWPKSMKFIQETAPTETAQLFRITLNILLSYGCYLDCRCDTLAIDDLEFLAKSSDPNYEFRCTPCHARKVVADYFDSGELETATVLKFLERYFYPDALNELALTPDCMCVSYEWKEQCLFCCFTKIKKCAIAQSWVIRVQGRSGVV